MKVNIEIDLSPQEARELMGWPDMENFYETMQATLNDQLNAGGTEALNAALKPFLAEGQRTFDFYQKLMENYAAPGSQGK